MLTHIPYFASVHLRGGVPAGCSLVLVSLVGHPTTSSIAWCTDRPYS